MDEEIYARFVAMAIANGYEPAKKSGRHPAGRLAILKALDDVLTVDNFLFSSKLYEQMKKTFKYSAGHRQFVGQLILPRGDFVGLFYRCGIIVIALDVFLQEQGLNSAGW